MAKLIFQLTLFHSSVLMIVIINYWNQFLLPNMLVGTFLKDLTFLRILLFYIIMLCFLFFFYIL